MHPQLRRALEPVLRDLAVTGAPVPEVVDEQWAGPADASALLRRPDGGGSGVRITLDQRLPDQVREAADQVQEWAIEALWGTTATNWPPCPRHPATHPLEVRAANGEPAWACPRDGTAVAAVGALR